MSTNMMRPDLSYSRRFMSAPYAVIDFSTRVISYHQTRPALPGAQWVERMARFFIVCLTLSLAACTAFRSANRELDNYVGRPVSDVAQKLGAPTSKFDLGDGRRAFEWQNYGACSYSVVATTTNPSSPSLTEWKIESWQQTEACVDVRR